MRKFARERIAVLVVHELLVERLRHARRDPAVHLALGDHGVDDAAGIVDGDDAPQLDRARLGVDLDDRDVGAEGERRRVRLEDLLGTQLVEPPVGVQAGGQLAPRDGGSGRADHVEAAGALVEHDVLERRLELLRGELAAALDHDAPPDAAATPPIWVDFEP